MIRTVVDKEKMVIQVVDVSLFDQKTIGELGYSPIGNYLQIFSFYVHKSYRRKGYGTVLINKLKEIARKKEVEWIQVFPDSKDDLSDEPIPIDVLNKIYEKYGFTDKKEGFDYSKPGQLMKMHMVN